MITLYDLSVAELRPYVCLTDRQLRNHLESESGLLIAESPHVIESALEAGCTPLSLLGEEKKLMSSGLCERFPEIPAYTMPNEMLEKLTGYALTRGVLCAMERPHAKTPQSILQNASKVAVLEGINDSSNLGAIFRSAAALGMDGVLLAPDCCDPYSRKSLRVSMGAVFRIPFARFSSWPQNAMEEIHRNGFSVYAMALCEDSVSIKEQRIFSERKRAILLGAEGNGLKQETLAHCDCKIIIPMSHGMDSLNVAAAAAIGFWELGS